MYHMCTYDTCVTTTRYILSFSTVLTANAFDDAAADADRIEMSEARTFVIRGPKCRAALTDRVEEVECLHPARCSRNLLYFADIIIILINIFGERHDSTFSERCLKLHNHRKEKTPVVLQSEVTISTKTKEKHCREGDQAEQRAGQSIPTARNQTTPK